MSALMRAYAVLQGGGVKGAALAGAVAAAQARRIEFAGYGGTSAGAIVAALFAVGYDGNSILNLLLTQALPRNMLDEDAANVSKLSRLLNTFRHARETFRNGVGLGRLVQFWWENKESLSLLKDLKAVGLYSGSTFAETLDHIFRNSPLGKTEPDTPITFRQLQGMRAPILKIVASNLTTRKALIFDAERTPDVPVVHAVRASMSFPFVFQPYPHDGHLLSDGGLSSNLPVFLFNPEHNRSGYPIIGIGLADPRATRPDSYDLPTFIDDLASCALEASDQLFREFTKGVDVITVDFERRISTLNFDVSPDDIRAMYGWGENSANRFLNNYNRLSIVSRSSLSRVERLQALFAPKKIVTPAIWAVKLLIESRFKLDIKVDILLPLDMEDETTWLSCYAFGYDPPPREIEVTSPIERAEIQRCVNGLPPSIVDLSQDATTRSDDLRCAAYFPIASPDAERNDFYSSSVRALLRIGSSRPIQETGWIDDAVSSEIPAVGSHEKAHLQFPIHPDLFALGATWTSILYLLARSQ